MKTSSIGRIRYLDGWRGIAIAFLLLGHLGLVSGALWDLLGVELFFALSGRLMAEILFEKKAPIKEFIVRRISRVWPGLAFFVVTITAFAPWLPPIAAGAPSLLQAFSALTFSYNYAQQTQMGGNFLIGHSWSLCVEEHSYLVLICIALACSRRIEAAIATLLLISMCSLAIGSYQSLWLAHDFYRVYFVTTAKFGSIGLPAALYLSRYRLANCFGGLTPIVSPILIVLGCACFNHRVPLWLAELSAPIFLGLGLALLENSVGRVRSMLENSLLRWLGTISYSIYLWQQPFALARETYLAGAPHQALIKLLLTALCLLFGLAGFSFIEKPSRRWLNGKFGRGQSVGTSESLSARPV